MKKTFTFIAGLLYAFYSTAQTKMPIDEASKHIGQTVTICDKVYDGKLPGNSKSQPTLLNLGGVVPNQKLTIIINVENRKKFAGKPEDTYTGKNVCVTGKLIDFKGQAGIIVTNPDEIQILNDGGGDAEIRIKDFLPFD